MAAADMLVVRTNAAAPLTQADPADGGAETWPVSGGPLEGLQEGICFPPPIEHVPLPQDVFYDLLMMEADADGWAAPGRVSRRLATAGFTPAMIRDCVEHWAGLEVVEARDDGSL
eukprot:3719030-Alexandrium_andersonii.AAC.1